jgi:Ran GTPase-activating protein (RanGAP) involved in mRNA processing and transport
MVHNAVEKAIKQIRSGSAALEPPDLIEAQNLATDDLRALTAAISDESASKLTTLSLARSNIGDAGAIALADGIRQCRTLQAIDLRTCGIGAGGAVALADAVAVAAVTELRMGYNEIGGAGAAAIAERVVLKADDDDDDDQRHHHHHHHHHRHHHHHQAAGDGGRKRRAAAARGIETLDFDGCFIGGPGFSAIAGALAAQTSLTSLTLGSCAVGAEPAPGLIELADALRGNSTLTALGLRRNSIGARCAARLAAMLCRNSALVSLDLAHNAVVLC